MRNLESFSNSERIERVPEAVLPLVQGSFADFDEFTESTAGWDIDFRQVGKGRLSAELLQLLDPQLSFAKARFDQVCLQSGAAPEGMRTFAILDSGSPDTRFCGQDLTVDTIGMFGHDGDFMSTSPPGFNVFTLSIDESWLSGLAQSTLQRSLHDLLPGSSAVLPFNAAFIEPFRAQLHCLERSFTANGSGEAGIRALGLAKQELANGLLNLLASRKMEHWACDRSRRHRLLRQAREYVKTHLTDPVRVMDVAVALGVTVRTVELVFRELLDVTPQAYIMTARLYAVRRALKEAGPDRTVSAIAGEWGFWHQGQFAREYRARFDELPSKTLARR